MTTEDRKQGLAKVFDAAADHYRQGPAYSWGQIGAALVAAAAPKPGERVLDVASGAGTTAIPAAKAVGPTGSVVAIDLSEQLLELAAEDAAQQRVTNLTTHVGDMEATGYADGSFDVVLCSLGIFFTADIPAALRELWRMVAPGGRLAISTWAGDGVSEVFELFFASVKDLWPELPEDDTLPWDSIGTPAGLAAAFATAGTTTATVQTFALSEGVETDHLWALFMGAGLRGLLDRFSTDQQLQIRDGLVERLADRGITSIDYRLLFAVATKQTE